jgi:DNA ligase-1
MVVASTQQKFKVNKMSEVFRVIYNLENHPSRLNKEAIVLAEAKAGNNEFFAGAKMALDPMITFGVKQVPERTGTDGPGLSWFVFNTKVQQLISRQVTGNAARDLIEDMMDHATNRQWNNWYRRILIKDLRCGVSDKTINKVVEKEFPNYVVPIFACQLAHDSANHESKVTGSKLVEVKLDGVRVLTVVYPDGRVNQYSRNGKELVNFEHIKAQFAKTCTGITEPVVFDGEVMSSSFQDLMKQVHRKSNVNASDAVLHLFDILTLSAFEQGVWRRKQVERSEKLRAWKDLWREETPNIEVLDQELIDLDTVQGQARFEEINQKAIDGGYEGLLIKDPDAPYECKRTASWLKLKPFIEVSLEVVGVEEGTGRNVGRLGALVCSGSDLGKNINVNVGSGFSDSDRDSFWTSRNLLPGQIVEIRADAVTMNQDGTYSLRFPRFLRFRGFAAGEKI